MRSICNGCAAMSSGLFADSIDQIPASWIASFASLVVLLTAPFFCLYQPVAEKPLTLCLV
jgi:hypothetical protein